MKEKRTMGEGLNIYGNPKLTARRNLDGSSRNSMNLTQEELAKKLIRESEMDQEIVTGRFRNLERRGQSQDFCVKLHDWAPWMKTLEDGQIYSIPAGIVKYINKKCYVPKYANLDDTYKAFGGNTNITGGIGTRSLGGQNELKEVRREHRFAFDPIDFSGNPDLMRSDIVEVRY